MKHLILAILLVLCGSLLFAQISNYYVFSSSSTTYSAITGTSISDILTDDALSAAIPIGFTFNFGEMAYTTVKVSSNGWVGLGELAESNNLNNELMGLTPFPILAPLWDDLSLAGGACSYITSGTAPNRVFTVQYQNVKWNYDANNQHNFQVKLYEDGKIEFIYGTATGTPNLPTASIGIMVNPGGANNFYSITPGTMASASYLSENAAVTTFPANGTKYTFDVWFPTPNDLSVTSVTGNQTPSASMINNYTTVVKNVGTATQSNYSVNLMSGTSVLASTVGQTIAPGTTLNVVIPWTPTSTGPVTVYAKVVLNGDSFFQNDTSPALNVVVQPAGTIVVTIGDGNETANMPLNMYWKNSLFETIYRADEINMGGAITGISLYNDFVSNLMQKPTKIWLGTTQQDNLSTGWIPSGQLTLVYDGNVDYPSGTNTINITFPIPFVLAGTNLVMMVQRPMDTQYYNSLDQFQCQTSGTNRTRLVYSDQIHYDPASPPAESELSGQFPKASLFFASVPPNPVFSVSPSSKDFGTVLLNATATQQFSVLNIGGSNFTLGSISISGSPFFTLTGLPVLPAPIGSLQNRTFTLNYHPTAAGNHTATITITDNLARTTHTVDITAQCMDPIIYTSPYFQNFDNVTIPNLPLDWNRLYIPAQTWGVLGTVNDNQHSIPNSVSMYNYDSLTGNQMLIAPPLAQNLIIQSMRVKFWAKGGSTSTLQVGVLADITDPETFSSVSTVNLNPAWTEYIVAFQTYEGAGRYMTFKHGNAVMYDNIFIDDVTIENTPQNDLAALRISGNSVPVINSANNYTVTLYNWGTIPQSNYQVKLYKAGDIEIGSVAGPTINPGTEATATISWTPLVAGNSYIYGKVVLANDQNTLNDKTPNMNILVMSSGTSTVTIGTGNQLMNIPVVMSSLNSLFETIYHADYITSGGQITGMAFYNNFISNLTQKPIKVWLGNTELTNLTAGWIPSTQLTLVFDGLVDFPSGQNLVIIPFTNPFTYIGTNLVMMVNRPIDTTSYSYSDQFLSQTMGTNTSISVSSDWETLDPANPPTDWFNLSGNSPKTSLFFNPNVTTPQFGVIPANKNYGTVLLNSTNTQVFTVFNSGGAPLTVNSVVLAGSTMYNLLNVPALPLTLNSGQNFTFTVQYLPTAAGTHDATITITDNQARSRIPHTVALSAVCIDPTIYTSPYFQNFDAVTTPALPIDWYSIYQANDASGNIQTTINSAQSAPNCVQLFNGEDDAAQIILIAPPLSTNLPVVTMRVKFWAHSWNATVVDVGVISDTSNPSTFQSIAPITTSDAWTEYVVSFQTYTGTGRNIAFKHGNGGMWETIFIDNVLIETIPQNDLAAVSVTGNTTPSVGAATNYTVGIFNWGSNPQSTYQVKLFKEGDVELASVAGTLVNPGLTTSVTVPWTPATVGATYIYAKVVLTGDQNNLNNQTSNLNVSVQPAGIMVVTIGGGTESARMPIDFYWHNSLNECIYPQTELNTYGVITGIALYNNFFDDRQNMPTKIWMGMTTQTDLSAGWIPSTQLTQVFDGNVSYPIGENTVLITFPQPFIYVTGNLVVMFNRPMDTAYYSSEDYFQCQTIGLNRTRNIYSDAETFDPANPPTDDVTVTGTFAKTSFFVIPSGVGHLTGLVRNTQNIPLNNATVQIVGGAQATTNAQGQYQIQNIIANTYQVTASRFGYISQTVSVVIPENTTVTQNFSLTQMPTVNVTGMVVGSDAVTIGLPNSTIALTGMENYTVTSNAVGQFTIPGVYTNQTYQYRVSHLGYQVATGTLNVGASNVNMGTITLNEIAYSPAHVVAMVTASNISVSWQVPDPSAVDVTEGFESAAYPPVGWSRVITNNGPPNLSGVYPTWCRFGIVTDGETVVTPPEGEWQSGFWLSYGQHQDEWLITPSINCPQSSILSFETYAYFGSLGGDHYYVKISTDNGNTWDILWDASALTGGRYNYTAPITIDLSSYAGQQIKLAWHADDPATNDGMWYNWFIDDVMVYNNDATLRITDSMLNVKSESLKQTLPGSLVNEVTSPVVRDCSDLRLNKDVRDNAILPDIRRHERTIRYKVWRLISGQEQNENNWTSLTNLSIAEVAITDAQTLLPGTYKWAVKAIYTGGLMSPAAFSNPITIGGQTGTLVGFVRDENNVPIVGATVTAGFYSCTTETGGAYFMLVPPGNYTATCSAPLFTTATHQNTSITANHTTNLDFVLSPYVENIDEIAVTATMLNHNYPNPFNPHTTISYDVKGSSPVRIEIYNTKGQLVRKLVNETKSTGRYHVVWNGKDDNGHAVTSGVYYYRMLTGNYRATNRMMLMK